MKFIFEFLSVSETFSRGRADLAYAEYSRTQALLRDQRLACQRETDKVNSLVAATAYFKEALNQPTGNTVFSVTAPLKEKGPNSSGEPEKRLYMSNCMFPRFTRISQHSHLYSW